MEAAYKNTVAKLQNEGLEVLEAPVCRRADEFLQAIHSFEEAGADAIVTLHLAYSPSLESEKALTATKRPLIVLDTTPDYTYDQHTDLGALMFNHGIHGVQDMCNFLIRNGKEFRIFAGHMEHSDVLHRVAAAARAAMAANAMRHARVGVGGDLDNQERIDTCNDILDRAEKFGISGYTFSHFKNEMHPDDPGAFEYYDAKYGKLFDLCPKIKGFIVVGEACEFPSKDPRTTGKSWRESKDGSLPSPGWFPCSDYPQFLSMLKAVIDKHAEDVEFVFWTYNWGYEKLELRRRIPRHC